jgi:hypothetical protein
MEFLIPKHPNRATREKLRAFSKPRERIRTGLFIFYFCFMVLCPALNEARAQTISHEYPLKAVFLYNFAQFTDWPTNAFDQPDSPLVIGILGNDPFGALLDDAIRDENVNGRKFVVKRYRHVEEVKSCHILFISQSETSRLDKIMAALKYKPVLTVSDIENSAYHDICIRLITEKNKIRLRINMQSLQEAKLTLSSKLLRVAETISPTK